jgi:DNA-binding NarL/FixJ family response regulator
MVHHKLLLISQAESRLEDVRQYFKHHPYELHCTSTPEEAVELYRRDLHHIVICDVMGTDHDMVQLLNDLSKISSSSGFILISPKGHTVEIENRSRNSKTTVMSQPVSEKDIHQAIENLLKVSSREGDTRREHRRLSLHIETQCSVINPFNNEDSKPVPALLRDISRSGVSMIQKQLLPVPAMIKLSIQLSDQTSPMNVLAKTISCTLTQINGVYRVGAKLVGLLPAQLEEMQSSLDQDPESIPHEDIYMGRSFQDAVQSWLKGHQDQLPDQLAAGTSIDFLAHVLNNGDPDTA